MLQIQDNYLKQIYVKDIYIEAREEGKYCDGHADTNSTK